MPESYFALEVSGRFVTENESDESYGDLAVIGAEAWPDTDVPGFIGLAHRLNQQLAQYKRFSRICTASLMRLRVGIDELTVATADLAESSDEITI